MVKIKAAPLPAWVITRAKMRNTMLSTVDTTAASCGLLPKGAATKKDQLARRSPRRTWTTRTKPTLVRENTR